MADYACRIGDVYSVDVPARTPFIVYSFFGQAFQFTILFNFIIDLALLMTEM